MDIIWKYVGCLYSWLVAPLDIAILVIDNTFRYRCKKAILRNLLINWERKHNHISYIVLFADISLPNRNEKTIKTEKHQFDCSRHSRKHIHLFSNNHLSIFIIDFTPNSCKEAGKKWSLMTCMYVLRFRYKTLQSYVYTVYLLQCTVVYHILANQAGVPMEFIFCLFCM